MAEVKDTTKLEAELRHLQRERDDVEYKLRGLEAKERNQARGMTSNRRRLPLDNTNNHKRQRDINSNNNNADSTSTKKARLSSVVTGSTSANKEREKDKEREKEGANEKEKRSAHNVTSAIVQPPEKPKPTMNTTNPEVAKRNRKLFGALLQGTLTKFKKDMGEKAEVVKRVAREEIEHKVEAKVQKEQETFLEQQQRALQEEKEKELAKRAEIKKKQEEMEAQILATKWQKHKDQLSLYLKTETKPHIYYKPRTDEQIEAEKGRLAEEAKKATEAAQAQPMDTGSKSDQSKVSNTNANEGNIEPHGVKQVEEKGNEKAVAEEKKQEPHPSTN